jgi:hypothetical protein
VVISGARNKSVRDYLTELGIIDKAKIEFRVEAGNTPLIGQM